MKMPYGKHKGQEIDTLPSGYLLWIAANWREDTPKDMAICVEADREYRFREKHGAHFEDEKGNDDLIRCPHCGKAFSL